MLGRQSAIFAGALLLLLSAFPASILAQWNPLNPVTSVKKQVDGVVLTMKSGTLRLLICSDSIVRVTYAPGSSIPETSQYAHASGKSDKTSRTRTTAQRVPGTRDRRDSQ